MPSSILFILLHTMVAEVTGKAIEETTAVVLRHYHDRKHKCSMTGLNYLFSSLLVVS